MKSFKILSNTVLMVELPEGAKDASLVKDLYLSGDVFQWYLPDKNGVVNEVGSFELPSGNWQLLGNLTSITEDEGCQILGKEFCDFCSLEKKGVYNTDGGFMAGCEGSRCDDTRETIMTELQNAILAAGYYLDGNPLGSEPLYYTDKFTGNKKVRLDWQEAQSRVLNRERTYIFKIKE